MRINVVKYLNMIENWPITIKKLLKEYIRLINISYLIYVNKYYKSMVYLYLIVNVYQSFCKRILNRYIFNFGYH